MARIYVRVDDTVMFDGDVVDWAAPPTPPQTTGTTRAADMPPSIRAILARAMCEAIEKATGFKFRQV